MSGHHSNNNDGVLMDIGLKNNMYEINSNSYHSGSQHSERSNDTTNNSDENWEELRRLLSNFHHCVGIELPILLDRTREIEARLDMDHRGHDEISRHYFDLRRCFRNMQELLSREDLLILLDKVDFCNGNENTNSGSSYDSNGDAKNDFLPLLEVFVCDLVQLSSISIFDDDPDNGYSHGVADSGVQELYRSLVKLAANRFPIKATLDDDQIALLLTRVLSMIEQESHFLCNNFRQERSHCRYHEENSFMLQNQYQESRNELEPLQCLLSWLNREMTVERLCQGVLLDGNEAAMALQIPLEFLEEATKKRAWNSTSTINHSQAIPLSPQIVLSLRILIDLLLGTLNSFVVGRNDDRCNDENATIESSCMGDKMPSSLREWMLMPKQHQKHDESKQEPELDCNSHLRLLKLLDKYTLELVEETLEILRPRQRKNPPLQEFSERNDGNTTDSEKSTLIAGRKRDRHGFGKSHSDSSHQGDSTGHSTNKSVTSMMQPQQRVVKVLQHAAMTTNAFAIMESNVTTPNGSIGGTNGTTLVFAGLSRSFWRAFAGFIIEEVDCLNDNEQDTIHSSERGTTSHAEKNFDTAEECRIAATDVLFRLTKIHVQAILFRDQSKETIDSEGRLLAKFSHKTIAPLPPTRSLSEEEFSIVLTTILRLIGHSREYWTEENQAWVATLLRIQGVQNSNDPNLSSNSSSVDVASKLRKALQATLISFSFVPDVLSFEEQRRVNSSIKSLLLPSPTPTQQNFLQKRKCIGNCSTGSSTKCATREDVILNDPWESFWAIRSSDDDLQKRNNYFAELSYFN